MARTGPLEFTAWAGLTLLIVELRSSMVIIARLLLLSVLLSGCGATFAQRAVSRRFSSTFGCPNGKVTSTAGGYRVDGCGVTASYACLARRPHDYHPHPYRKTNWGDVLGAAVVGAATARQDCILEHSERRAPPSARREVPVATSRKKDGPLLTARTPVPGGRLELRGKPLRHPRHALLVVHAVRRLPAACGARLFVDGVQLPVEGIQRASEFEVHVLVVVESLGGVHESLRFAGEVCGVPLELDQTGRTMVGQFAMRFAEERARLVAPGTVASAAP